MITVFAMTYKGYCVVRAIHERFPSIIKNVVSAPDNALTRDYYQELAEYCQRQGIPFLSRNETATELGSYVLAVSWRWLIRTENEHLIVFHDSLLPKYRGFNPLVTALLNGDRQIGVTALHASENYDTGDIVAQRSVEISYPIPVLRAIESIVPCYVDLALFVCSEILSSGSLPRRPQVETDATYSLWRDDRDYFIPWGELDSATIARMVDAVGEPYSGARSTLHGRTVEIVRAETFPDVEIVNRTPGKVVFMSDGLPVVVCKVGLLRILEMRYDDGTSALPLDRFRSRFEMP